jgi:hypothetical protein
MQNKQLGLFNHFIITASVNYHAIKLTFTEITTNSWQKLSGCLFSGEPGHMAESWAGSGLSNCSSGAKALL